MRPTGFGELKVFSGSAHPQLAAEIAEFLGVALGQARLRRFPDTEVSFQIDENIRGTDVFVVQPTCAPVDQHLMELLVMIDAFRRSSAARITAVIPYYGYARQDRKDKPRVPISAKLVANLLSAAGREPRADDGSAQGADPGLLRHPGGPPVRGAGDHRLPVAPEPTTKLTIVVARRGRRRARPRLRASGSTPTWRSIDKRRSDDGTAEVMNVIGDVEGRTCVIAGRHHRHGRHDPEGGAGAQGQRRRARARLRRARRAVGPGDRADREGADRQADHHQHDPARRPSGRSARRSWCCRWRACSGQAIRSIHEETSVSSLFV